MAPQRPAIVLAYHRQMILRAPKREPCGESGFMSARSSFVLVHGGGHGGWCWSRTAPLLRQAGGDVYAPTLTGLGERAHLLTPKVSLDTHIEDVVNAIVYEDLRQVVLVGHSYGGMVISGVADRVPERIAKTVYLDAAIPLNGESLADTSPGLRKFAEADMRIIEGVELVLWPSPITRSLYGLEDPADWAWAEPRLTPHPYRTFTDRLHLQGSAKRAGLPRYIINCTHTLTVRQPDTLSRWFEGEGVFEIDAPHDLMITHPRETADLLLGLP